MSLYVSKVEFHKLCKLFAFVIKNEKNSFCKWIDLASLKCQYSYLFICIVLVYKLFPQSEFCLSRYKICTRKFKTRNMKAVGFHQD